MLVRIVFIALLARQTVKKVKKSLWFCVIMFFDEVSCMRIWNFFYISLKEKKLPVDSMFISFSKAWANSPVSVSLEPTTTQISKRDSIIFNWYVGESSDRQKDVTMRKISFLLLECLWATVLSTIFSLIDRLSTFLNACTDFLTELTIGRYQ